MVWGAPGIGKSWTIREFARKKAKDLNLQFLYWNKASFKEKKSAYNHPEKYFILIDNRLLLSDPTDLKGYPEKDNELGCAIWEPPLWVKVASNPKAKGIIFFDELPNATPMLQKAAYSIILDGFVDEMPISDNMLRTAAGNRIEDNANTFEMPTPLRNRFSHFVLSVPLAEDWVDNFGIKNGLDERVLMFVRAFPDTLFRFNPRGKENAFPTPRTWHNASSRIKNIKYSRDREKLLFKLVSSTVGTGTASEFIKFLQTSRSIDFEDLLKHPSHAKNLDLDLRNALVSRCIEYYNLKPSLTRCKQVVKILDNLDPEYLILGLRIIKAYDLNHLIDYVGKDDYMKDIFERHSKYLHISDDD